MFIMNKKLLLLILLLVPASCLPKMLFMCPDVFTVQNKRAYQEDRISFGDTIEFAIGLYDGHGGDQASDYLQNNLHHLYNEQVDGTIEQKMQRAFALAEEHCLTNFSSGSTAITFGIDENDVLHCSWVGDSRAVLEGNGKVVFATEDHKPDALQEKQRIEAAGGNVYFHGVPRVNGLAVSRSIGDRRVKAKGQGQIIAVPEYKSYQLTKENNFFVMASDGLWDVMTNEEVVEEIKRLLPLVHGNPGMIAHCLTELAMQKGSQDNITISILFFAWDDVVDTEN